MFGYQRMSHHLIVFGVTMRIQKFLLRCQIVSEILSRISEGHCDGSRLLTNKLGG